MKSKTNEFELVPRGSDVQLKIRGATLQELFRNAVKGVASYLNPGVSPVRAKETYPVKVEAVDINSLLVEFLSEIISRSDIESVLFTDAKMENFGENFLEGELSGSEQDVMERMVQGVSYQDVDIKKNPESGMYEAAVILEV